MKKPKIIGFDKNGKYTFLKEKNLKDQKELMKYEFFLISIATYSKGPMYTIRRPKDIRFDVGDTEVSMNLVLCGSEMGPFTTTIKTTSIFKTSSIMPAIAQNFASIMFLEDQGGWDYMYPELDMPVAAEFHIKNNLYEGSVFLEESYSSAMNVDLFKKAGLLTRAKKTLYSNHAHIIFLCDDHYEFYKNNTRFDDDDAYLERMQKINAHSIIISLNVFNYETLYIFTYEEYVRLMQLERLDIYIRDYDINENTLMDFEDGSSFEVTAYGRVQSKLRTIISAIDIYQNMRLFYSNYENFSQAFAIKMTIAGFTDEAVVELTVEESLSCPLYPIIDKLICSK